jgi:hypothetical protein
MVGPFTLIVPYYRNVEMLKKHITVWESYPEFVKIILVDDGSPEKAEDVLHEFASPDLLQRVRLLRVEIDIPWNRGGARNLGARQADTTWIVHIDIDHILPLETVIAIYQFEGNVKRWYRFRRFRVGKADETRKKDALSPDAEFGEIKPHVDSYLCTKRAFWDAGGYDEDYSGCLGGGNPFLAAMEAMWKVEEAPKDIISHVYTRSVVRDASDFALSRDPAEYSKRRKEKTRSGNIVPSNPIRFPWSEVFVRYPKVQNEFDTLNQLTDGKSIARFGDGEMKLITGGAQIREPANPMLAAELRSVLTLPPPGLIVGIPTMNQQGPKYKSWQRHADRMAKLVAPNVPYYSAFISRPDSAPWIFTRAYAEQMVDLWKDKKTTLVSETTSKIFTLVVGTCEKEVTHIPCPHRETYAQIDKIMNDIVVSKPEVVVLSAGPAATCMAARLSALGIQALDVGSMGGFILKALGFTETEEALEDEPQT